MALPTRFRLALSIGQAVGAIPEFRGRDRVLSRVRYYLRRFDVAVQDTYAGGIRFQLNPRRDGSLFILFLRFSRPALAPVFDAVLSRGDFVADVGASIGLYSMYAARRVGPEGHVYAFEPVPHVASCLRRNLTLNGFDQVEVVEAAVGAAGGTADVWIVPDVTGLGSKLKRPGATECITVTQWSLDDYFRERRTPKLLKIDAEGMDLDVLRGAWSLLSREEPPIVVFEADASSMPAGEYPEFRRRLLEERGFEIFVLGPGGARPEAPGAEVPGSPNLIASRRDVPWHARAIESLRRARFPRNQNM